MSWNKEDITKKNFIPIFDFPDFMERRERILEQLEKDREEFLKRKKK